MSADLPAIPITEREQQNNPLEAPIGYRQGVERALLTLGGAFLLVNLVALAVLRPEGGLRDLTSFFVWAVCAAGGHAALNRWLPRRDALIFPVAMFLSGWGLVLIDRLAPRFADRQIIWLAVSVAAMLFVAGQPYVLRWLRSYRYLWLLAGLILLFSTIILGTHPTGQPGTPQLWLDFGGIYFQPSEALKIVLVAFLASYLAEQYPSLRAYNLTGGSRLWGLSPRVAGPILLMWGLSVLVLVWQRDLGTAALFFGVFLVLLYVASGYTLILVSGAVLTVIAGVIAYNLFDVVELRIDIWLSPWPEADGRAYQIVQSLHAFAAGGIFGQGIGQGLPVYIPVNHSDFIFAALAEEYGLLGVLVVIAAMLVIVMRGLRIAILHQGYPFHALLTTGLCTLLALQTVMIMGGVIRLLPLTGVTLPFVSYGGSSLLASYVMIGLLLRLSARGE